MGREFEGTENTVASDFYIKSFHLRDKPKHFLLIEIVIIPSKKERFLTLMAFSLARYRIFFMNKPLKFLIRMNREQQSTITQLRDH